MRPGIRDRVPPRDAFGAATRHGAADRRASTLALVDALVLGQLAATGWSAAADSVAHYARERLVVMQARGWVVLRAAAAGTPALWTVTPAGRRVWGEIGGVAREGAKPPASGTGAR